MNSLILGIRNAFRNIVRSFSIITILGLSIGLALTMLVARQAVVQKIRSVKSNISNGITISPAGFRGFSGQGNPLTDLQIRSLNQLPHIVSINESLTDRLDTTKTNLLSSIDFGSLGQRFISSGGDSGSTSFAPPTPPVPPVQVIGTTNLSTLSTTQGGGTIKITNGATFDPTVDAPMALVGSNLAVKNSLSVGSTFQIYGTTFKVNGTFDAGNSFSNNLLIIPLPTLQRLSGQVNDITSAHVQVDSIDNLASVTSAIKNKLGSSADVVNEQDNTQQAIAPLENIKSISQYSLIGAIIAGTVIILLTMIMIVRERRREIGVLKAIGASNWRVIMQFMTEAITFTMLAAVIGIVIGIAGSGPVTHALVSANTGASTSSSTNAGPSQFGRGGFGRRFTATRGITNTISNVHTVVSWSVLVYGLAAALLIAIIGSSFAAWLIVKVRPSEVMRAE